jgi:phospholipid/cholesterol/gamma-HCH transport system permease protein
VKPPGPAEQSPAWDGAAPAWRLALGTEPPGEGPTWPADPPGLLAGHRVLVDGRSLVGWDTGLAARLWPRVRAWRAAGIEVDLSALPPGLQHLLDLASGPGVTTPNEAPARAPDSLLAFVGEVVLALGRWVGGRGGPRAADVLQQLDETGPRSAPIVLLACALVGLMLAYMGGAQLGRIGAQNFLADVVTVGMVRELGGMMTGIILAGRVGSAFAAQLATMKAGEEIDALRVLGLDPVTHLVLPRLLALALVAPALIIFGAAAGVLAGWPAATLAYGVSSGEYLQQSLRAVDFTHLSIGLFKGQLYVLLVGLAGCRAGLAAGRSAEAVGAATTRAVVHGLLWIVAAAAGTTVVFTALGF